MPSHAREQPSRGGGDAGWEGSETGKARSTQQPPRRPSLASAAFDVISAPSVCRPTWTLRCWNGARRRRRRRRRRRSRLWEFAAPLAFGICFRSFTNLVLFCFFTYYLFIHSFIYLSLPVCIYISSIYLYLSIYICLSSIIYLPTYPISHVSWYYCPSNERCL